MEQSLRQNLSARATWLRGLYMLLFVIIYSLAELLVAALAVFQFLAVLFTGRTNPRLDQFGRGLSEYIFEIVQFFTFGREEKPFPFAAWPGEAQSTPPARSARRRAPAKKKSGSARAGGRQTAAGDGDSG